MTTRIGGLPYWELTFDAQGDPHTAGRRTFLDETRAAGLTDLFVFSHGWNSDRAVSVKLFKGFYGLLAAQLDQVPAGRGVKAGLAGVIWPSRRWADEPVPNFDAPSAPGGGGGAAATSAPASAPVRATPGLDPETLDGLREVFPTAVDSLDRMAALLTSTPTEAALAEFHRCMQTFAEQAGAAGDDGEDDRPGREDGPAEPGMLLDEPAELFARYRDRLQQSGVELGDGEGGGEAGVGDRLRGVWQGAKEALRQLTYWQMKNRAGDVGRKGLGPLLGDLHAAAPQVRIHLLGHSFGARLVSYALAGLPDGLDPSPVKAVTLLQGAFSHFAFAAPLPFNARRDGALAGMLARIDGPLTVCFSEHDKAVGIFYPLASMAARDDSAAGQGALFRWGGMGADGAQGVKAKLDAIQPAGPGARYRFAPHQALNIDAGEVVRRGGAPAGAHSDIVHPELTWIALSAGRLVP